MNRNILLFILFAVGVSTFGTEQTSVAIPASQKDVRDAARRIERSIKEAAQESRQGESAARSAEKREHDDITKAIDSAADVDARTEAAIRAEGEKTQRTIWFVGLSSVGLIMIFGAVFALRGRRVQNAKTHVETQNEAITTGKLVEMPASQTQIFAKLPDDPTPSQILKYAKETGIDRFPLNVHLPNQGNIIVRGEVFQDSHGVYVVKFPGGYPVNLDYRRRAAQESFLLGLVSKPNPERATATN